MRMNRFIPRFLLDRLNRKIDDIIINNKKIDIIEERLNKIVYDVYQNYPPHIIQTETVKYQIKKFIELYNNSDIIVDLSDWNLFSTNIDFVAKLK